MSVRIIQVPVPETAAATPSWQAAALAELTSALDAEVWGNDDFSVRPEQVSAGLTHQENATKLRYLAVDASSSDPGPEDVVGTGSVWLPLRDNTATADVHVGVRPDARGQGVGTALLEHLLSQARRHDRTVLQGWGNFGREPDADDPSALSAPTGSGRVPGNDPGVRFALKHGFVLQQAERHSVLDVPVDPGMLERFRSESTERAGSDYELISWSDRAPEEWVEEFCVLQTRMSTDAPAGGLTVEEEVWTPERLRAMEAAIADNGVRTIAVAALHRPSGELAGYTEISTAAHRPESSFQENTIVRSEHRGHRLGMLLKAANLQRLTVEYPRVRRVHTWNAEENSFMLNINVALGFAPAGGGAAWERTLTEE